MKEYRKKGFTLIEVIVSMVITLIMIMIASSLVIDVIQTFNSQTAVVDARSTLSIIEARFENIVRSTNGKITISKVDVGSEINGYSLTNYNACYFYNTSNGRMEEKNLSNPTISVAVEGLPKNLNVDYEISSIIFDKVSGVDNAMNIKFNVQPIGSTTETQYQELVLSTLNPNVPINKATGSDAGNEMLCIKESSQ
jgi:prepilin-type N-terminal cleavage/methylation domain-containing protein